MARALRGTECGEHVGEDLPKALPVMAAEDASVTPPSVAPVDVEVTDTVEVVAEESVPADAAPEEMPAATGQSTAGGDSVSAGKSEKVESNETGEQGSQASCQDYTEAELEKFLEDSCQWIIFEDPEDEVSYLRRRGGVLACGLRAAREEIEHLHEAGVALQDAYERLQKNYREVAGDVAYWQELAKARAEELATVQARGGPKVDVPAGRVDKSTNTVEAAEATQREAPLQNSGGDIVFHECEMEAAQNTEVNQAHDLDEGGCNNEEVTSSSPQAAPLRRPLQECQPPQETEGQAKVAKAAILPKEGAKSTSPTGKQVRAQPHGEPEPEESHEALQERQQRELREALRAAAAEAAEAEALRMKKLAEQRTEEAEVPRWFGGISAVTPGRRVLGTCTPPHGEHQAALAPPSTCARTVSALHIAAAGSTPPKRRYPPKASAASPQLSVGSPLSSRGLGEYGSEYSLSEVADSEFTNKVRSLPYDDSDVQSRGRMSDAQTPPRQRTPLQSRTPTQSLAAPRTPTAKPSVSLGDHDHSVGSSCGGSRRALFCASPTSAGRNKSVPGSAPRKVPGLGTPSRRKQLPDHPCRSSVGNTSPRPEQPQGTRLSALGLAAAPPSSETPWRSAQTRLSPPPQFHQRSQLGMHKQSGWSSAGTPQRASTCGRSMS